MPQTAFIVEDQELIREVLRKVCTGVCNCEVTGEALSGSEAVRLLRHRRPDLLLLDIQLPDMNGFELLAKVRTLWLRFPRIIAITCHCDDFAVSQSRIFALDGFVDKSCEGTGAVANAINTVLAGGRYYSKSYVQKIGQLERDGSAFHKLLTPRQRDILRLNAQGLDDLEVSKQLKIAPRTAENHRLRAMGKLGISSVLKLAEYAFKKGLWY